jgi:hypothetical protein
MTSLFFIMLVLFVVTVGYLKVKERGIIDENDRLKRILKIEEQFKPLEENGDFYYLSDCKKYIAKDLMGIEIFQPNQTIIQPQYIETTKKIGEKIRDFLRDLSKRNPDLSYLLVIEGNMANKFDKSISKDNHRGYTESYQRALAVYNLWQKNGIDLRRFNTEVLICGSGFNGLCRDNIEENNKRFSIQIIPKVQNNLDK